MKRKTLPLDGTCPDRVPEPGEECLEEVRRTDIRQEEKRLEDAPEQDEAVQEGREREETEKEEEPRSGGEWKWVLALLLTGCVVAGRLWWKMRSGEGTGGHGVPRQEVMSLDGLSLKDARWALEEEEAWRGEMEQQMEQRRAEESGCP